MLAFWICFGMVWLYRSARDLRLDMSIERLIWTERIDDNVATYLWTISTAADRSFLYTYIYVCVCVCVGVCVCATPYRQRTKGKGMPTAQTATALLILLLTKTLVVCT